MSRINTNNCVCHSEHSEESREGKGKEIHRSALNDKLVVNGYAWYTVSERRGTSPQPPLQRGEERKQSVGEKGIASRRRAEKPDVTIVVHSHVHY